VPELAQELGVRAMPTFYFFKDGEKVDTFTGANPPALLNMLNKYNPAEGAAAETAEGADKAETPKSE
jgi:thioredoxin 1